MSGGQVREAVERAFREYETEGVPSSGSHEPVKSEIRYALGALLEETLSSIGAGITRYETIADRDAAAAPADGSLVYVFRNNDDPADPANGVYQYDAGAPGYELATWYYDAVAAVVQPLVDDAETAATAATVSASQATTEKLGAFGTLLAERGGWFWNAGDETRRFSDAAGAVPASPDDRIYRLDSVGAAANPMQKHASYEGPYLRTDARGFDYLEFIGNTEDRALVAAMGGNTDAVTAYAVIRCQSETGTDQIIVTAFDGTNGWNLAQDNAVRFNTWAAGAGTAAGSTPNGFSPNRTNRVGEVIIAGGSAGNGRAIASANGHYGGRINAALTASADGRLMVGHNLHNSVGEANIHIYALCVFPRELTIAEQEIIISALTSYGPMHGSDKTKSALSHVKNKIELGAGDVGLVFVSDSLGDTLAESLGLLGPEFAKRYPEYAVEINFYGYDANGISLTSVLQDGSNGRTIRLELFAQSGGVGRRFFADRYALIEGLPAADILVSNVGKNIDDSNSDAVIRGEYLAFIEQFRETYPNATVAAIMQPPNLVGDEEETKYRVLRQIMDDWRQFELIDVAAWWKSLGNRQIDFEDYLTSAIHPGYGNRVPGFETGSSITARYFMQQYDQCSVLPGAPGNRFLATAAASLLADADFAAIDDWTAGNGAALSIDAVVTDGGAAQSLKVAGAGGYAYQRVPISGTEMTLSVRSRASAGEQDSGKIELRFLDAQGTLVSTSGQSIGDGAASTAGHSGAFLYTMIAGATVPAGATQVEARLYGSETGGWFSEAVLVAGRNPRSLA